MEAVVTIVVIPSPVWNPAKLSSTESGVFLNEIEDHVSAEETESRLDQGEKPGEHLLFFMRTVSNHPRGQRNISGKFLD